MTAVGLAAVSAFLFGAMTVLVRAALRRGVAAESGTLVTVSVALAITAANALARGEWDLSSAWAFLLAGLLAPGLSQILFTFAVRDAGASRTSVTVGTAPLFAVMIALVFLDEPVVAGLLLGAALIVTGGILLAAERGRPQHFRRVGVVFALGATLAFALRDSLIRWLGTEATDVEPGLAACATMVTATVVTLAFVAAVRARPTRRAVRAFLPAGVCYGLSYITLFEAFFAGRVSVVSPIVATESLWGVTLSWLFLRDQERVGLRLALGAVCIVAGGVLIGVFR